VDVAGEVARDSSPLNTTARGLVYTRPFLPERPRIYETKRQRDIGNDMELIFETWPIDRCVDYARNPRKNDHAVDKVAAAIREFGFRVPIVAKSDGLVVDGHLRLKAAKKLGLTEVPVILADDMSEAQIKAFRLSVNKVAELAEWDNELLGLEIMDLKEMGFDLELTGFDADEIGALFDDDGANDDTLPDQKELHATFEVAVECSDEAEQETVFNLLTKEGYKCRILTM
jgi:ParB-like chromosome segregation protein Spo0J